MYYMVRNIYIQNVPSNNNKKYYNSVMLEKTWKFLEETLDREVVNVEESIELGDEICILVPYASFNSC